MKFPYGISDFKEIITKGYLYCDRTAHLPLLEKGKYLLFIRPRRFGKTLLLSMLANYYDVAQEDQFDDLFGRLDIGPSPTPLRNHYFILQWDFSCIDPSGSAQEIKQALHNHINVRIKGFLKYYGTYDIPAPTLHPEDAVSSLDSLMSSIRMTGHPVYLLINEYDAIANFANEVQPLFKDIKSVTSHSLIDRMFITGVSPVVMSDITSGYNIAENIYLDPVFNELCGFTHAEVAETVKAAADARGMEAGRIPEALDMMRVYYNGYRFAPDAETQVYNPTLALYFLKALYETRSYPRKMLDANLALDAAKEYISQIPKGGQLLLNLMEEDHRVVVAELADRFGIREMLTDRSKDRQFMVSFLYYFGVLTINGLTSAGEIELGVPNLVMRKLYVERLQALLLPDPWDRDEGTTAAKKLYQTGDMKDLCEFVETKYFKVFHNPDYRWANELTVKTAFLTLLYNDILYIMDSESELDRRRADLTMIVRPDMRKYTILDILIEFKFVPLKDVKLSAEAVQNLTQSQLQALAAMISAMESAKRQANDYGDILENRHGNIRLRKYAVVSLGFERIWWTEVA